MNEASDDFVAVVAILVIFGLPLSYAIVSRYLAHQERMAMIRSGVAPPPDPRAARRMARFGGDFETYGYSQYQASYLMRRGITLSMIGFALLIGLSFVKLGTPGPWLLGGLIPLFVGLAQVIIAVLSGARFGAFGAGMMGSQTQQPGSQYQRPEPQPTGYARDAAPGPYAWRLGRTPEIEPPPRPPDRK